MAITCLFYGVKWNNAIEAYYTIAATFIWFVLFGVNKLSEPWGEIDIFVSCQIASWHVVPKWRMVWSKQLSIWSVFPKAVAVLSEWRGSGFLRRLTLGVLKWCTDSLNALLHNNRYGAMRRNLCGNSSKSAACLSPDVLSPYCSALFDKNSCKALGKSYIILVLH